MIKNGTFLQTETEEVPKGTSVFGEILIEELKKDKYGFR